MKIATYNINGVNGRIQTLLKWLKAADPDIVCLQELKCEDKSFPIAKINDAGYQTVWVGQKAWNGVAVLSVVSKGLKEYESLLTPFGFLRCHQSYLVNFKQVKKYYREGYLQMENKESIPVSSRKKEEVLRYLENIA